MVRGGRLKEFDMEGELYSPHTFCIRTLSLSLALYTFSFTHLSTPQKITSLNYTKKYTSQPNAHVEAELDSYLLDLRFDRFNERQASRRSWWLPGMSRSQIA